MHVKDRERKRIEAGCSASSWSGSCWEVVDWGVDPLSDPQHHYLSWKRCIVKIWGNRHKKYTGMRRLGVETTEIQEVEGRHAPMLPSSSSRTWCEWGRDETIKQIVKVTTVTGKRGTWTQCAFFFKTRARGVQQACYNLYRYFILLLFLWK